MPFDSNGVFSLTPGYLAVTGQTILPTNHNPPLEDIAATGLSQVLVRDGRAPMIGNLNLGGFKIASLLAGTALTDGVNKGQMDTAIAAGFSGAWQNLASAATTDLGSLSGQNIIVTGTTTITSFGTSAAGTFRRVRFAGALILTYNATSLILPGNANITTAAGDVAEFVSEGSGNWRCIDYLAAINSPKQWTFISSTTVSGSPSIIDFTNLGSYRELRLTGWVTGSGATGGIQLRVSANNGSSYDSGATDYTQQVITASVASVGAGNATSASMQVSASSGVVRMSINALVTGFNQATRSTAHFHCYGSDNGGIVVETVIGGERNNNTAHNAFRLLLAAGTFSGGELILEGFPG